MLEAFAVSYWRGQSTLHEKSSIYHTEENRWILPWELLWYLVREKWVAYTRNFLLWYANRFPHVHTILIFRMLISCMKRGFAGLSSFVSMSYFCLLPGTSSSKIILNEKLNLYLSHTFDNIPSTLHTIYLPADLIILLWWVHTNANLILTVHPGFLLHPDKIFPIFIAVCW